MVPRLLAPFEMCVLFALLCYYSIQYWTILIQVLNTDSLKRAQSSVGGTGVGANFFTKHWKDKEGNEKDKDVKSG